jgi:CDP-4-dehydro-6-deoxyglucose reductase, E3
MEFKVTIQPSGHSFVCRPAESLLTGALREGYGLPYGCRSGACGTCKGRIISGTVDYGDYQKSALSDAERSEGKALFCRAVPTSDVVIESRAVAGVRNIDIKKMPCRVERIEKPNHDVAILEVKLPANETFRYLPGQYIDILLKDGRRRSFSMAGAPGGANAISLHIRHYPGGEFSGFVFNEMKERTLLRIEGPLGTFFLREDSDKPIVFMAGGTGFAPIKAIIEHALAGGTLRPMVLYWGARSREDLYMAELPGRWQSESDRFTFVPVLSDPKPEDAWPGRTGFVHQAILDDFADLSGYQVYSCGPPAMVEAGRKAFVEQRGLPEAEFYSDPFVTAADAEKKD